MIRNAWLWMSEAPRRRVGVRALQIAVGLMLWFRTTTEWSYASYLWGPRGLAADIGHGAPFALLATATERVFATELGTRLVLSALLLGAVGLVTGIATRVATLLALVAFSLLEVRLPELLDGGDNIVRLTLLYMVLLAPRAGRAEKTELGIWLHNVGVVAIALQVMVLYLTAGFCKAAGIRWNQGTAMYLISQVDYFSVPGRMRMLFRLPLVTTLATYAPMFFQLWFPVAMASRLKLLWLAVGIFFHLGVAGFMGLVPFSTVMIGLDLCLVSDPEYERAIRASRALLGRMRSSLEPLSSVLGQATPWIFKRRVQTHVASHPDSESH